MTILLAPTTTAAATPLGGRTFRKQVLKAGSLDYRQPDGTTRKLTFDDGYFADLSRAFREKAYDAVKAVVATDQNAHTMDPERLRGDVVDLVPSEDGSGLDAIMTLSESTAALVREHPDLGVSARIVEGLQRGDGKSWPRAIQHVLLTTDPRVTGLAPWREVSLSVDDTGHDVIDLSTETPEREGAMALSDEEMEGLAQRVAALMGGEGGGSTGPAAGAAGGDDLFDVDDEELELFLEGLDEDEDDGEGESYADADLVGAGAGGTADLSTGPDPHVVELANQNAVLTEQMGSMQAELSAARWERERDQLLTQGVPPHLLDLAAPVLEAEHQGAVIDLSNRATGQTISPAAVIRELLRNAAGYVDLSAPQGHNAPAAETSETAALHAQWETVYGGK